MPAPGLPAGNLAPRSAVDFFRAEVVLRDLVAPVAKRAFGELHDVALVHEGDALALVLNRVADRAVNQTHAAGVTHRLDPDADPHIARIFGADRFPKLLCFRLGAEANLREVFRKFLFEKRQNLLRFSLPAAYSMPA